MFQGFLLVYHESLTVLLLYDLFPLVIVYTCLVTLGVVRVGFNENGYPLSWYLP